MRDHDILQIERDEFAGKPGERDVEIDAAWGEEYVIY
jgi:hypothetical protein